MTAPLDTLQAALSAALGERLRKALVDRGQLTIEIAPENLVAAAGTLRDDAALAFTELLDLIGIDYRGYANTWKGSRYAVVYNLLSIKHNARVRIRVFCAKHAPAKGIWSRPHRSIAWYASMNWSFQRFSHRLA